MDVEFINRVNQGLDTVPVSPYEPALVVSGERRKPIRVEYLGNRVIATVYFDRNSPFTGPGDQENIHGEVILTDEPERGLVFERENDGFKYTVYGGQVGNRRGVAETGRQSLPVDLAMGLTANFLFLSGVTAGRLLGYADIIRQTIAPQNGGALLPQTIE